MKNLGALTLAVLLSLSAYSQQVIALDEGDVDITVLTWHYSHYEKSTDVQWTVVAHNGVGHYVAKFSYQEERYEASYDENGNIMSEKKFYNVERIPTPVVDLLDYRIVKYKVEEFTKEAAFENKKEVSASYRVSARTKTGGQVLYWFDQDMNLLPEKKRNELATR